MLIQQSFLVGDAAKQSGWVHAETVLPFSKANIRPSYYVKRERFEGVVLSYHEIFERLWDASAQPTSMEQREGPAHSSQRAISQSELMRGDWVLNYNPARPRGWKTISFLPSGYIGFGRNGNEDRWELLNSSLRITRADGSLQNDFVYDSIGARFICANAPQALGLPDQTIYRDPLTVS